MKLTEHSGLRGGRKTSSWTSWKLWVKSVSRWDKWRLGKMVLKQHKENKKEISVGFSDTLVIDHLSESWGKLMRIKARQQ